MNISELARKLSVNPNELKAKLPELGFDVGLHAIKIDNSMAEKIVRAWRDYVKREEQKKEYLKISQTEEKEQVVLDKKVEIPSVLTVKDFALILKTPVTRIIADLMKSGVMATLNQKIDFDTAAIVAADLGFEAIQIDADSRLDIDKDKRIKEKLTTAMTEDGGQTRPPIVVVMGHVDHGKTKLLDVIRKTNVMEGEAGGITQHIGAYQVEKQGRKITFIDTPGHEAFTAMRSRGAKVADIAILVVAATEGVKPQTVEALKIAQEANIPIIVAINKIDLPESNPDKVKQELANYNLLAEEWGGKTAFVPISAKYNTNIDAVLDNILLVADLNEDKIRANPEGAFVGSVVESHIDKGEGPVSTMIVQNGTLRVGDNIVVDNVLYGKIRLMRDYKNTVLTSAGPSMPAKIIGLKAAPKVGDILEAIEDPRQAKKAKAYDMNKREESFVVEKKSEDEENKDNIIAKINIVLRTDMLGSQEAIIESLKKIEREDVKVEIVSKGLGNVTESDVLTAEATGAIIFGFNVISPTSVNMLARDKKVEIKTYRIIYELFDEAKRRLKMFARVEVSREDLGKVEVLALFKKGKDWQVIGGRVNKGKVEADAKVAVLRKDEFITSGKITAVQIGKQEVKDALKDQECGLKFSGQPLIEVGDILDVYKEQEKKKSL